MKNTIYLFLIAVVFLCSCKGNSFLSQRYTHFGHGASKKADRDLASHKAAPQPQYAAAAAVSSGSPAEALQPAARLQSEMTVQQVAKQHKRLHLPALKKQVDRVLAGPAKAPGHKAEFQQKQDGSAAVNSREGLLSGLLGLILYIVLCAVVIAAIIILVLIII